MEDNIAISAAGGGVNVFSLVDGIRQTFFSVSNVQDATLRAALQAAGLTQVNAYALADAPARRDGGVQFPVRDHLLGHMRAGEGDGILSQNGPLVAHTGRTLVRNFRLWNIYGEGIFTQYSTQITFQDGLVLGNLTSPNPYRGGLNGSDRGYGVDSNEDSRAMEYDNLHVEGFDRALRVPYDDGSPYEGSRLVGGYFANDRYIFGAKNWNRAGTAPSPPASRSRGTRPSCRFPARSTRRPRPASPRPRSPGSGYRSTANRRSTPTPPPRWKLAGNGIASYRWDFGDGSTADRRPGGSRLRGARELQRDPDGHRLSGGPRGRSPGRSTVAPAADQQPAAEQRFPGREPIYRYAHRKIVAGHEARAGWATAGSWRTAMPGWTSTGGPGLARPGHPRPGRPQGPPRPEPGAEGYRDDLAAEPDLTSWSTGSTAGSRSTPTPRRGRAPSWPCPCRPRRCSRPARSGVGPSTGSRSPGTSTWARATSTSSSAFLPLTSTPSAATSRASAMSPSSPPPTPTPTPTPTVPDMGLEQVAVGSGQFQYRPTGSPWAFAGGAGISANGSGFTSGNPPAPEGTQVAFLQNTGSISQAVAGWAAGSYRLTFYAAQRANYQASRQDFQRPGRRRRRRHVHALRDVVPVLHDRRVHGAAGSHTITFQGLDSAGGDNTAFVDQVPSCPRGARTDRRLSRRRRRGRPAWPPRRPSPRPSTSRSWDRPSPRPTSCSRMPPTTPSPPPSATPTRPAPPPSRPPRRWPPRPPTRRPSAA